MKYIQEFRDIRLANGLFAAIEKEVLPEKSYRLMEFCGGHTHAIARYALTDRLPKSIRLIHGPGCPVCVLPAGRVAEAIALAEKPAVIFCCYGDTLRIPATRGESLLNAKARGADVRIVYSISDALKIAADNPVKEVVFFAIGFETTTPPTAFAVQSAKRASLSNFSVLCCHVLTLPAIHSILADKETRLDGFIGPAHVSTIIGSLPYQVFAENYQKPVVIAGFEPLDVLQAILQLVRQVNQGKSLVENEFARAVTPNGNLKAQRLIEETLQLREEFEWRGLGLLPYSAWRLRDEYAAWDAEIKFSIDYKNIADHKGCDCGEILRGKKEPEDCKLFGRVCHPENPIGACMVSSEGACAARYAYGQFDSENADL